MSTQIFAGRAHFLHKKWSRQNEQARNLLIFSTSAFFLSTAVSYVSVLPSCVLLLYCEILYADECIKTFMYLHILMVVFIFLAYFPETPKNEIENF